MTQLDDEATGGDQGGPHQTMIITEPEPLFGCYTIVADCRHFWNDYCSYFNIALSSGQLAIASSTLGVPEGLSLYLLEFH